MKKKILNPFCVLFALLERNIEIKATIMND